MKRFRKIVRAVVVSLLLILVAIPAGVYVVVSTPWAQEKLRQVAAAQLTSLLGTDVEIGRVVFHPYKTLSVTDVRVNDDNGRRALHVGRISARFELWTFLRTRCLDFDYAVLDSPEVYINRATPGAPLNIQGIIDRFKPKDKNKTPTEFNLKIGTVVLRNGRLNYDVLSAPDSIAHFNPNHIHLSDIDLHAYLRHGSRENWDVDIESMSFDEQSGLTLSDLTASVGISPKLLSLRDFKIAMPGSSLALNPIELRIEGLGSIAEILRRRSIVIEPTEPATLALEDLAWLSPSLKDIDRTVTADFQIDAAMSNVNINHLELSDDHGTKLDMMGSLAHLDSIDGLEFNILRLNMLAPAGATSRIVADYNRQVAAIIGNVGDLSLHGSGHGDLHGAHLDFSAHARGARMAFNGDVTTPDRYKTFAFTGAVDINDLDLSKVISQPKAGIVDASLKGRGNVAGKGIDVEGHLEIARLQWQGYDYSDINIDGAYNSKDRSANVWLESTDPNAAMSLRVDALLERNFKDVSIEGHIGHVNLHALNLAAGAPYTFEGDLTANGNGNNIDDFAGTLTLSNIIVADTIGNDVKIKEFYVDLDRSGSKDLLTISSDVVNGTLTGRIVPSTIAGDALNLARAIVPDVLGSEPESKKELIHNDITADITIANAESLCHFLRLPLTIIYPVSITSSINGDNGTASFTLDAPFLQQGDKIIDQTVVSAGIDATDSRSLVYATTHMPTKKGPMTAIFGISGSNNRFDTQVDWMIERKIPLNGQINFSTLMGRSENGSVCVDTDFNPGQINFGDNVWEIATSSIDWRDNLLTVDNFSLTSGNQKILIDGIASATDTDTLTIGLANISLAPIFETLEIDKALIGGRASGTFTATSALSKIPQLSTDNLHVDSIGYNYCTLGDADVKANWDNDKKSFFLDADITNPEGLHSHIYGDIYAMTESLDLNFNATHVKVGFMKPFMAAFTSDISGYVSGKARLYGTFKDIDLMGDVYADDLHIKIDFTNTWYTASDSIHIDPGLIKLDNITIRDTAGKTAKLNGWLRHEFFHNPVFEFNISEAHDFLCYNVNSRLNPDWYGTIYGNGSASVKGHPGVVEIGVDMATAPHSTFTFVLSDRLDAEQYSFITFNDVTEIDVDESLLSDDIPQAVKDYQKRQSQASTDEPSNYIMKISMDITEDAELIIVMDPVGGDRIRAFGDGNMVMEYNAEENYLGMRGKYTLDRGNYNFTLQDIIIKDFTIEQGSSITFNGDPYQAELDLKAVYSLNANLSDLDKSFSQDRELNRTNVPVQALLNVKGDMRQPNISFDLRFPSLTSDTYRKVKSIISTEEMMSRQIIYLLALNRFYTPDYMDTESRNNEIFSVAASTITSQISNMLGKLSDKWSIAPNLRSDNGDFSDIEVDVALSSRLLNNRLLLNGNFGYRDKSLNTNQFIGDFDIEYLLTPRGTWRLKAYSRYNDQNYYLRQAATTQGIGIIFKRDFDSLFPRKKTETPTDSVAAPAPSK